MAQVDSLRILIATTFNDRPDVAVYRGLVAAGFDVDLICLPGARDHDRLAQCGIEVTQMTILNRLNVSAIGKIRQMLKTKRYQIVYAPRNSTLSVCLLASAGMKTKRIGYRGTIGHLSYLDPASWLTYLNPKIDRIICVSDAVRRYLLSMRLPSERLVTIYKGHDPSWYSTPSPTSLVEFGVPAGAFVVGFTGNMRPVKGVDVLIRSALHLPVSSPIHFLLVGEVRDRRIERLAADEHIRHRFHFTGFRDDAPALAGACNAFVMPSVEREGLPRSLIEAMAQGIPSVVSNVGGMPELVVDGECGLVVPPREPLALASAFLRLAQDTALRQSIGKHARIRIQTHFNIQSTIEKTIALFREVTASLPPVSR
jgi:glycosyltransferase involved in cell wall biosynthesis